MPSINIKVEGLDKLVKTMGKYPIVAARNLDEAIKKSIFEIQRQTVPITPIDTGELRRSIGRGIKLSPLRGEIGPTVSYAVKIHEGTARYPLSIPPRNPNTVRQFLRQGVELSTDKIETYFNDAIKKTFKTITRL